MDSNPSKSGRGRSASGRVRGVILSPQGWQKFQTAKQQAESDETWGKHFTQEDLGDRTGLSLNTLARIFKREQGVDRQSLEYLFRAFGLELTEFLIPKLGSLDLWSLSLKLPRFFSDEFADGIVSCRNPYPI